MRATPSYEELARRRSFRLAMFWSMGHAASPVQFHLVKPTVLSPSPDREYSNWLASGRIQDVQILTKLEKNIRLIHCEKCLKTENKEAMLINALNPSHLHEEDPNMYFVHSIAAIELEEVRGSLIKVTYSVSKLTSSWPRQICSSERPHLFPLMQYNLDH